MALELLHQTLRRAGFAWRRANRVFESKARRMLRLHGVDPPPYAPGVLLPAPTLLAAIANMTRASIFHGTGFLRRTRPRAEAAAARALAMAADAKTRVTGVAGSAWQALPAIARTRAAEAVVPVSEAAKSTTQTLVERVTSMWQSACERMRRGDIACIQAGRVRGTSTCSSRAQCREPLHGSRGGRRAVDECTAAAHKLGGPRACSTPRAPLLVALPLRHIFSRLLARVRLRALPHAANRHFAGARHAAKGRAERFHTHAARLALRWARGPTRRTRSRSSRVLVLMACGWSLNQLEMGLFWYRMVQPYATDTSSLAFNSAIFSASPSCSSSTSTCLCCRSRQMKSEPRTRFYCQFGKRPGSLSPPPTATTMSSSSCRCSSRAWSPRSTSTCSHESKLPARASFTMSESPPSALADP